MEAVHANAQFFTSLFFQQPGELERRIRFVAEDGLYAETDVTDREARALIDYLGFNDHSLFKARRDHVERLRMLFADADWDAERQRGYLREHATELSFPTALSATLDLDLVDLVGE